MSLWNIPPDQIPGEEQFLGETAIDLAGAADEQERWYQLLECAKMPRKHHSHECIPTITRRQSEWEIRNADLHLWSAEEVCELIHRSRSSDSVEQLRNDGAVRCIRRDSFYRSQGSRLMSATLFPACSHKSRTSLAPSSSQETRSEWLTAVQAPAHRNASLRSNESLAPPRSTWYRRLCVRPLPVISMSSFVGT